MIHDPGVRTIVLDDDPTGTQCAANVTVLLGGGQGELAAALRDSASVYYETNTRSLDVAAAVRLVRRVRRDGEAAAARLGIEIRFVLRGDSTLRGHVFEEAAEFLDPGGVILFVPAYPEGGRTTEGGVHFLNQGGGKVPVALTEFAKDPVFGYSTSDLGEFVRSRSHRPSIEVPLARVRAGLLQEAILAAPDGAVVIPDAVTDGDIRQIAQAVDLVLNAGRQIVVRCAAPLAAELAGVRSDSRLEVPFQPAPLRLLVACGSHTQGARSQVDHLAAQFGAPSVIRTESALEDPMAEAERVAAAELEAMDARGFAFIATERTRLPQHGSLAHGSRIMTALTQAATLLIPAVDAVITKGGITSSEIMRTAAGATRTRVLGQFEPGISAMTLETGTGRRLVCVVVPGNVGDQAALARIVRDLGFDKQ